jgi:hypothetical protein
MENVQMAHGRKGSDGGTNDRQLFFLLISQAYFADIWCVFVSLQSL